MPASLPAFTADKYLDAAQVASCATGRVMAFPAPTGDGFVLTCVAADGALATPTVRGITLTTLALVGVGALATGILLGRMVK